MKIVILSPNVDVLINSDFKKQLENAGDVVYVKEIKPISEISDLHDNSDKVLAIDPDFCDWKVSNEDIENIPNLRAVCLQTTSFGWIDTEYLKTKGIPVTNLRGFSTEAVAEWAILMALNVARKIPLVAQENWKYDYGNHTGFELKGKKAGVIGLGRIGTRIAELCQGFGMEVKYWSKNSRDDCFQFVKLEELMTTSDIVFPAIAKNDETKKLITDDLLKSMKKEAIFINIVSGMCNNKLLFKLVRDGKIYGCANEDEGCIPELKGNIWAGIPLGWCTNESMQRNAMQWVESIVKACSGDYPTRVN